MNIYLKDYSEKNKIIEYNINNVCNHFYITNDFLRTYKKIYYLNFNEEKTIKKDEKINIILKLPIQICGENFKYIINDFDKICCLDNKCLDKKDVNIKGKIYIDNDEFDIEISIKYIISEYYIILNYTTEKEYNNIKSIGYNIYFNPHKLDIVYKNSIISINEEIDYNLKLIFRLIDCNINIEELYFENSNLKLFDYTKLKGTITSDFPILEYKINDKINNRNIKLIDEGYNEQLDKYVYRISSVFVLKYHQKTSIYDISITDCNFYSIKKVINLPINIIYK